MIVAAFAECSEDLRQLSPDHDNPTYLKIGSFSLKEQTLLFLKPPPTEENFGLFHSGFCATMQFDALIGSSSRPIGEVQKLYPVPPRR
jgi:hypothetical protein